MQMQITYLPSPQVIGGSLVVSLLAIGGELLFARCAGRLVHRRIAAPY